MEDQRFLRACENAGWEINLQDKHVVLPEDYWKSDTGLIFLVSRMLDAMRANVRFEIEFDDDGCCLFIHSKAKEYRGELSDVVARAFMDFFAPGVGGRCSGIVVCDRQLVSQLRLLWSDQLSGC